MCSSPVRLLLLVVLVLVVLTAELLLAVSTQQLPAAVESESALQSEQARARHQAEQHEAKIRLLETKTEQLQEAVLHLQTKTTRLEDALHNNNNHVTTSSWSPAPPPPPPPPQRRGLATCNASAGARLLVEGVCSCTEDVVVAGRSVMDQFDQFNESLHALETRVEHATGSVSLASGGGESNCSHRLGALLGVESKGALKDSTNMDYARSVALDVDAGLAYVAARDSDSLAIVDVGTDPSNPTLVGVLKDSTNMDGTHSVALDVDAGLAYVAAGYSDSLAIVDVKAVTWCAQDFSVSTNRRNITAWL